MREKENGEIKKDEDVSYLDPNPNCKKESYELNGEIWTLIGYLVILGN